MSRKHFMQFKKPIPTSRAFVIPRSVVMLFAGLLMSAHLSAQDDDVELPELAPADGGVNATEVMDAEADKRLALTEEAIELLRKGDEAVAEGKYAVAVEIYGGVSGMLPQAPVTEELRAAAVERYAIASIALAERLLAAGDLKEAKKQVGTVLADGMAPKHPAATAMMKRLNDPVATEQALTKELGEDVNKVLKLLTDAGSQLALGLYDDAERSYQEILRIDPYNVAASRGIESIAAAKAGAALAAYDRTRAEFLRQVDAAWELKVPVADEVPVFGQVDPSQILDTKMTVKAKLDRIFVPQIAFDRVTLSEAIDFLRAASIRHDIYAEDEDSRGINFAINLGDPELESTKEISSKLFNLQVSDVPLSQALKYINDQTRTTYKVDDYAVTIIPRSAATAELITRDYRVPPDFLTTMGANGVQAQDDDPFARSGGESLLTQRLSVREVLERQGVSFPDGASVSYSPGVNLLRVINTEQNQALVEAIVQLALNTEPVIVSVQVTLIRTQQTNLKELGFDWLLTPIDAGGGKFLSGGTSGNMPGRRTADFSPTFPLPADPSATVSGGLTNGLRSADQAFTSDTLDSIIGNFDRDVQQTQVAPGILALTGVFNDGQAQVVLRGLDQKKGVDVMATPSVATNSAQQARIDLVREFIYPTEYDPPELQQGGGGGGGDAFPVVPANPTTFEMREVGISLEVLPVAGDGKKFIDVTLNPSVVDLEGFVNFGSPINTSLVDGDGNPVQVELTENAILMPVFNTQRLTTQLSVADGSTIAFGGLMSESIENFSDQVPIIGRVPLLGRLFQSEGSRPVSTALVFLVKVDLMDPTGRLYRDR